jgi:hypothetical protein
MRPGWLGLMILMPLVGACATVPTGPSVMVLPGGGKSFEQFQADDFQCRQWANQQTGTTPGQAVSESGITSAAIGTVLGAAAGAAIGAAAGNPALGAAAGAGGGLLFGSASGVGAAQYSGAAVQQRYDIAYQQCMFAKGNQIPGVIRNAYRNAPSTVPLPPPPPPPASSPMNLNIPPPPPGPPPPPPPVR